MSKREGEMSQKERESERNTVGEAIDLCSDDTPALFEDITRVDE